MLSGVNQNLSLPNFIQVSLRYFVACMLSIILIQGQGLAQSDFNVVIDSKVLKRNKPLEGAVVLLLEDGNKTDEIVTPGNGDFSFSLSFNHEYIVVISKTGHASKKVSISTNNIPEGTFEKKFVPVIEFDVELFEKIEGLDVSILDKPIAKWIFDTGENQFVHDAAYTKSIKAEADKLRKELQIKFEEKYREVMTYAEQNFNDKNYHDAKALYQEALGYKPKDKKASARIKEIDAILISISRDKGKQKDEKYQKILTQGDAEFANKNYHSAKTAYMEALTIKAFEQYPKDKIKEIERIQKANTNAKYEGFIKKADAAFANKEYQNAKTLYRSAQNIKPNEPYPKQKIKEIYDMVIAMADYDVDKKDKTKLYKFQLAKADQAYADKEYQIAKSFYRDALKTKPAKKYPKSRIKQIDEILAKRFKLQQDKYDEVIAQADTEFNAKNYAAAIRKYQEALTILPNAKYAKEKIREIERITARSESEIYDKLITEADILYINKDYLKAQEKYKSSLRIKSNEKYPENMLVLIENIMDANKKRELAKSKEEADILALEERFNTAIANAEKASNSQFYPSAIRHYKEALSIKPEEKWVADKIKMIEGILQSVRAEITRLEKENTAQAKAEALKNSAEEETRKSEEARIKGQVGKIAKIEQEREIAKEEQKKLYLYELAQNYPAGITNDTIVDDKKIVVKVIVVKNNMANEYKKTTYDWGGIYYEKNGEGIKKTVYDTETKGK